MVAETGVMVETEMTDDHLAGVSQAEMLKEPVTDIDHVVILGFLTIEEVLVIHRVVTERKLPGMKVDGTILVLFLTAVPHIKKVEKEIDHTQVHVNEVRLVPGMDIQEVKLGIRPRHLARIQVFEEKDCQLGAEAPHHLTRHIQGSSVSTDKICLIVNQTPEARTVRPHGRNNLMGMMMIAWIIKKRSCS